MPSMDVQKPNTERVAQKPISAKNASDRKVQMRRLNLFVLDAGPSIKVQPGAKTTNRNSREFKFPKVHQTSVVLFTAT